MRFFFARMTVSGMVSPLLTVRDARPAIPVRDYTDGDCDFELLKEKTMKPRNQQFARVIAAVCVCFAVAVAHADAVTDWNAIMQATVAPSKPLCPGSQCRNRRSRR